MATTTGRGPHIEGEHYVYPHITKIPGVCGGRPAIDGTRVRVLNIVYLHLQGQTSEQIREAFPSLSPAQIHAALAYYYDHREEIQSYIDEDDAWPERYDGERAEHLDRHDSSKR